MPRYEIEIEFDPTRLHSWNARIYALGWFGRKWFGQPERFVDGNSRKEVEFLARAYIKQHSVEVL